MKSKPILLALFLASLSACHSAQADNDVEYHQGPWATDEIQNASMNNAIVAQHTLYAYHFVPGSAELNDLGVRDLNVLADHFTKAGGDVNVRRQDAGASLYEARVKAVLERLAQAGVPAGAVAVKDGPPGGDGISSERVVVILKGKMSSSSSTSSASASSSSAATSDASSAIK
jgi:hypothetical protein